MALLGDGRNTLTIHHEQDYHYNAAVLLIDSGSNDCVGDPRFTYGKFLLIEGKLQNQENGVSVKATVVRPLEISEMDVRSHDFH